MPRIVIKCGKVYGYEYECVYVHKKVATLIKYKIATVVQLSGLLS